MRVLDENTGNMKVVCRSGHSNEIAPNRIDVLEGRVECVYSSKIDFCEFCEAPIDEGVMIDEVEAIVRRG